MNKSTLTIIYRIALGLALFVSAIALFVVLPIKPKANPLAKIGVTFSPRAAEFIGLEWKTVYQEMLEDSQRSNIADYFELKLKAQQDRDMLEEIQKRAKSLDTESNEHRYVEFVEYCRDKINT